MDLGIVCSTGHQWLVVKIEPLNHIITKMDIHSLKQPLTLKQVKTMTWSISFSKRIKVDAVPFFVEMASLVSNFHIIGSKYPYEEPLLHQFKSMACC